MTFLRYDTCIPRLVAGRRRKYTAKTCVEIPADWAKFLVEIDRVPSRVGRHTLGVIGGGGPDGSVDYLCGVEVESFDNVDGDYDRMKIPEQLCAVFAHLGKPDTVRETWNFILGEWWPTSGAESANAPDFEFYNADLNEIEIWFPILAVPEAS